MDSSVFGLIFEQFDQRRVERFPIAQEFASKYEDTNDLLVDVANLLMILWTANKLASETIKLRSDSQFKPDGSGFRSDTR